MQGNGEGVIASVNEVKSGTVDSIDVIRSSNNFSVNSHYILTIEEQKDLRL